MKHQKTLKPQEYGNNRRRSGKEDENIQDRQH